MIRIPLGVAKYVLITSINYSVDIKTIFHKMVLISGMFYTKCSYNRNPLFLLKCWTEQPKAEQLACMDIRNESNCGLIT